MRDRNTVVGVLLAVLFAASEAGSQGAVAGARPGAGVAAPEAVLPATAFDPGKAIFHGKGSCSTCHGRSGTGTPLGPDLSDDVWLHFESRPAAPQLEALIANGVARPVRHPAPMPPMGGARLSTQEVTQLAAYVLSLSAGEPGAAAAAGAP